MSETAEQVARERFDFRTTWYDADDREAVRDHHAEIIQEVRGDGFYKDIPGLGDALQRLIDAGYSYQDISVMLGVPKHYVYRWCQDLDVDVSEKAKGGAKPRVWSDEENRFIAVDGDELLGVLTEQVEMERAENRKRRKYSDALKARRRHVRLVQGFVRRNGRRPRNRELEELLGIKVPAICYRWGYNHSGGEPAPPRVNSYSDALDRLYRQAGYPRP